MIVCLSSGRCLSRFDYHLHADIVSTARQAELVEALLVKVSRERVGIELEGMLSGKDARYCDTELCAGR